MKTLLQKMDSLTGSRRYSMFICWYCTDEDEREDWEEFNKKNNYNNLDWKYVEENWLLDESIQAGITYYMSLQHHEKMKNIYNKMYEQAMNGDVQSAKYLMDFSKDFFAKDNKNLLDEVLGEINLSDDDEE